MFLTRTWASRLARAVAAGTAALVAVPAAVAAPMAAPAVQSPPCVPQIVPTVLVMGGSYSPATRTTSTPGTTVHWQWNGASASVTSSGGLPLLKSRVKSSGTYSFTFWSAGSFPYHTAANTSQKGVVQVKMCNVPSTGHVNTATSFQVASSHHRGWVADVEVLRPGAAKWAWLKTDVTTTFVTFTPARKGTYQLRARLRDKAAKKASGFSPASTLRIS
jgi:plastocyanin